MWFWFDLLQSSGCVAFESVFIINCYGIKLFTSLNEQEKHGREKFPRNIIQVYMFHECMHMCLCCESYLMHQTFWPKLYDIVRIWDSN